jgi:hypothetical protein
VPRDEDSDDLPRDDPKAAAAFYRRCRVAGTWRVELAEYLFMMQSDRETAAEVGRLMKEIDEELGPFEP